MNVATKKTRKTPKTPPIRPLTRQRLLIGGIGSPGASPSPTREGRKKAYETASHSGDSRPCTAPVLYTSQLSTRSANIQDMRGTFLTGFCDTPDDMSMMTERDPDDESVEVMRTAGVKLSPLEASK